jgi:hypothetical protein
MSMSMLKGIHRRFLGITRDDQVIARSGFVAGGEDRPAIVLPGAPDTVAQFDDFLGDLIADEWAFAKADTGLTGLVIANITNGAVRLTGSETVATNNAETAGALTQGLFKQWKADMGGRKGGRLRLSARVKAPITAVAEAGRHHLFVGFSDSGGGEMPAFDTGGGIISNASDVVGFVYGPTSAANSNTWQCVAAKSVAGDSGDQLVTPSPVVTPVTNVYDTLEVEIRNGISDTGGAAHFWINGKKVGVINSPVKSDAALTPWIGGFVQDTGFALAIDVDYVAISAARDTGE